MAPLTSAFVTILAQLTILCAVALVGACYLRWNAVLRELLLKSTILIALATPILTIELHQYGVVFFHRTALSRAVRELRRATPGFVRGHGERPH